jgi:predicted MFS family arabinose efflux permease
LLITAYYASGFFDLVVGFLLKKNKPNNLINIGFAGCLLLFISLIFFHHNYWFVVLIYFILGAFIACIFVAVYKMMNEDYSKDLLISQPSVIGFGVRNQFKEHKQE